MVVLVFHNLTPLKTLPHSSVELSHIPPYLGLKQPSAYPSLFFSVGCCISDTCPHGITWFFPNKTLRLSVAPSARFYPSSATTRTGTRCLKTQSQCQEHPVSVFLGCQQYQQAGTRDHIPRKKASVDNSAEAQCQQLRRAARGRFARHSPETDRALAPETGRGPPIAPSHGSKNG